LQVLHMTNALAYFTTMTHAHKKKVLYPSSLSLNVELERPA
jgi:hypothetical protein